MLKVIIRGDGTCSLNLRDWVFAAFEDRLQDFKYRRSISGIVKLRDNGSVVMVSVREGNPFDIEPVPWEIEIDEFISDPKFTTREGYHIELLRLIRNYVEQSTSHSSIVEITLTPNMLDLDTSAAHDFAAMLMTPLKGFSKRRYILRADDLEEPFFVLLGRDPQAPDLLRNWADLRECCYTGKDEQKIAEARAIADSMESFKTYHPEPGMSIDDYEIGYRNQQIGRAHV